MSDADFHPRRRHASRTVTIITRSDRLSGYGNNTTFLLRFFFFSFKYTRDSSTTLHLLTFFLVFVLFFCFVNRYHEHGHRLYRTSGFSHNLLYIIILCIVCTVHDSRILTYVHARRCFFVYNVLRFCSV